MLAPAIAALTAIGVAAVVKMSAQSNKESMIARIVVSVAVLTTLLLQAYYVWSYYQIIKLSALS